MASALLLEQQRRVSNTRMQVFSIPTCMPPRVAPCRNADAEAASITTLLRNQQFDFGYHNKMHPKLRQIVRIRLSGSNSERRRSTSIGRHMMVHARQQHSECLYPYEFDLPTAGRPGIPAIGHRDSPDD
ncbi:protein of unknown function [Paraburkholderia dioscoreae]|uniref:Uncharacterized protein n=1 Tax=Paraburkholderia dioscoreae TaxID=2604047 RepID=A0A5Q4ZVX8_9BURK|nr:protein of unknown function [Paraburkholderia dioscoreae]